MALKMGGLSVSDVGQVVGVISVVGAVKRVICVKCLAWCLPGAAGSRGQAKDRQEDLPDGLPLFRFW
jgi:hypothetical protein